MSILGKIFKDPNIKYLDKAKERIQIINEKEKEYESLSNSDLKEKTAFFKKELESGKDLDDILCDAFATVREAAKRNLGQRAFDCQMIGGIALHDGNIVEMKTGEGKTLTSTFAVYLNALKGKGVHVVTVNDYLSRRDTVWMGQVYDSLGLSVACINHEQSFIYDSEFKKSEQEDKQRDELGSFHIVADFLKPCSRQDAYNADITYGTNNEFGFDYLKNNMVFSTQDQLRLNFNFAIIDEVDSILIDEARTPLIISGQAALEPDNYYKFSIVASQLKKDSDYEIDEKRRTIKFLEEGEDKIVSLLGFDPWQDIDLNTVHRLENAIRAKELFAIDKDYVVRGKEIIIVDEFTGRLMPGRRWSDGLHQAIEAKEHVFGNPQIEVQPESITLGTITFQNLFRKYTKLSGMTGTAKTSAEEFDKVYNLNVVCIPTNKEVSRKDLPDRIYKNENAKFRALIEEIKKINKAGAPVLVGTRSIAKNEYLSMLLSKEGIKHELLNAKNHEREGEIIAQAGKKGAVTIATNMAGRGVDILLGGNPCDLDEAKFVKESGGLHVIGTERHEARRIDNQLRGRSGRQGDPGQSQFFVSLDDDLMRLFGGENLKKMLDILKFPEDEAIEDKRISKALEDAQSRVEGANFDSRKSILEQDDVMDKHRESFYKKRQWILESSDENIFLEFKKDMESYGKYSEVDFENKKKELGNERIFAFIRYAYLKMMDTLWIEHLQNMNYLKESVNLRAYGNLDPMVEFKRESFNFYQKLMDSIASGVVETVFRAQVQSEIKKPQENIKKIVSQGKKIDRNDPCPCGSGKKYKKCCGT
ncbi:MAG TPA: preprotein translocase subunit SecA [Candidatus Pacearchaeota archaeon]|nr:preprotein translocase subunit SecA [Candidatus Parcubacteria bacterium]HOU45603.1 preprotein translocase subunit SecA [Candidatus Pacearchaeota archaeon]HQI74240.1 preprotein translocase subunit SecA [Candidatus Pacearchaeota archaeon]